MLMASTLPTFAQAGTVDIVVQSKLQASTFFDLFLDWLQRLPVQVVGANDRSFFAVNRSWRPHADPDKLAAVHLVQINVMVDGFNNIGNDVRTFIQNVSPQRPLLLDFALIRQNSKLDRSPTKVNTDSLLVHALISPLTSINPLPQ